MAAALTAACLTRLVSPEHWLSLLPSPVPEGDVAALLNVLVGQQHPAGTAPAFLAAALNKGVLVLPRAVEAALKRGEVDEGTTEVLQRAVTGGQGSAFKLDHLADALPAVGTDAPRKQLKTFVASLINAAPPALSIPPTTSLDMLKAYLVAAGDLVPADAIIFSALAKLEGLRALGGGGSAGGAAALQQMGAVGGIDPMAPSTGPAMGSSKPPLRTPKKPETAADVLAELYRTKQLDSQPQMLHGFLSAPSSSPAVQQRLLILALHDFAGLPSASSHSLAGLGEPPRKRQRTSEQSKRLVWACQRLPAILKACESDVDSAALSAAFDTFPSESTMHTVRSAWEDHDLLPPSSSNQSSSRRRRTTTLTADQLEGTLLAQSSDTWPEDAALSDDEGDKMAQDNDAGEHVLAVVLASPREAGAPQLGKNVVKLINRHSTNSSSPDFPAVLASLLLSSPSRGVPSALEVLQLHTPVHQLLGPYLSYLERVQRAAKARSEGDDMADPEEEGGEVERWGRISVLLRVAMARCQLTPSDLMEPSRRPSALLQQLWSASTVCSTTLTASSTADQALLNSYVMALFDSGISDDLTSSTCPLVLLRIAPVIAWQAVLAAEQGVLDKETLKEGLGYFLQDLLSFTLPGVICTLLSQAKRSGGRTPSARLAIETVAMFLLSKEMPRDVLELVLGEVQGTWTALGGQVDGVSDRDRERLARLVG